MEINSNKKLERFLNLEFDNLRQKGFNIVPGSKYFNIIGSTTLEDIKYENQLEIKLKSLKIIFKDLADQSILEEYKITPSLDIYHYRFKMDFVASYDPFHIPNSRFGQRKKGKFNWVVDMDECQLIDPLWFKKIRQIYEYCQTLGIRNYDLISHSGELRYFVSRIYGLEAMLTFICKSNIDIEKWDQVAELALKLGFKSLYLQKQDSKGDISYGNIIKDWGDKELLLSLNLKNKKVRLKVNSLTFFQNNINLFAEFLNDLRDYFKSIKTLDYQLLDLFSGVGSIGLSMADLFNKVTGIDISKDNIEIANENVMINDMKNVTYLLLDHSKNHISIEQKPTIAIIDPPRTGLMSEGISNLLRYNPNIIVYLSCNPITQVADLGKIITSGYKFRLLKGYDMFPQTNHIENLAILEKIN